MNSKYLMGILLFLLPGMINAHPGHGDPGVTGILHQITSPIHLLAIILAITIGVALYKRYRTEES
ncbi:MAG: hypothetical protein KDC53_17865 [Saprospiraceae bacterium]|nr:hypothetical protein [Saprospiraceae bacterium]